MNRGKPDPMQGLLSSVGGIDANLFNKPSMAQMKKSQGTQGRLHLYDSASSDWITWGHYDAAHMCSHSQDTSVCCLGLLLVAWDSELLSWLCNGSAKWQGAGTL